MQSLVPKSHKLVQFFPRYHAGCQKFAFDAKMLKIEESAKGDKDVSGAVKKLSIAEKIATKSRDIMAVKKEENNTEKELEVIHYSITQRRHNQISLI